MACLCHDIKHGTNLIIKDGLNTIFEVKSKSERATDFGYMSVL